MMNATLNYYNKNAVTFAQSTVSVDFTAVQREFLSRLPVGAYILDFGCGAGRDTKAFLQRGYRVTAIDGSEELCRIASEYTGIEVRQMYFQELEDVDVYDGIWACSSILHLTEKDLEDVLHRMARALHQHGVIYTSFKYGTFCGERNGRYFTDMTEETFSDLLLRVPELKVEKEWVTGDVRAGRESEKWLNLILQK